jgi:hypothetical protein
METAMRDRFKQDLAHAFLADCEARPDLIEAVLIHAEAVRAKRRRVMTAASLTGCTVAAGLITASGFLDHVALPSVLEAVWAGLSKPWAACVLGAGLLVLAAGRTLLQDV